MNIVLLRENDWISDDLVRVCDGRATHIRNVLQSAAGDVVRVGLLGDACGEGRIETLAENEVTLRVHLNAVPPTRHRFDIVLALPRPKMLRRILRTAAEFGVDNLHLINSARVEKSYWQSPLLHANKLNAALEAGLERSMDTIAPKIHLHKRFRPFVEDELTGVCAGRPCWLADMGAPTALADAAGAPAVVMIGPEGGFVPFEVQLVSEVIATPVHLGKRILSVDTALTAVLAQALHVPL